MAATDTLPHALPLLEDAVGDFLTRFRWSDINAADLESAKMLLKDQLAVQIGSSQLPWSRQVRRFVRKPRPGVCTVVADSTTMDAADAAYLNATYGHGFEYDDVVGNAHPGCCVVPVALAIGEELGASLGQTIEAMVAGYEVFVRLERLAAPDLVNMGWHPHGVMANFGAAATAAKLYGLDVATLQHALSIAYSHASGATEYTASGGSVKRVHAGIGVRNGIEAVELARAGVTGPIQYLTGNKGFYRNFIRRAVGEEASAVFASGEPLRIGCTWFKAYCSCGAHHAYVDAIQQVRDRAAEIECVEARIQAMTASLAAPPDVQVRGPRNIEELQFSLALQMALSALGLGNGYAVHMDYLEGRLPMGPDSDVVQFARRIDIRRSPELDARYPRNFVADITVHFRDGSRQDIFVDAAKGMPAKPFSATEHRNKLNELTHSVIGAEKAGQLFDIIDQLDPDRPLRELTALLRM